MLIDLQVSKNPLKSANVLVIATGIQVLYHVILIAQEFPLHYPLRMVTHVYAKMISNGNKVDVSEYAMTVIMNYHLLYRMEHVSVKIMLNGAKCLENV